MPLNWPRIQLASPFDLRARYAHAYQVPATPLYRNSLQLLQIYTKILDLCFSGLQCNFVGVFYTIFLSLVNFGGKHLATHAQRGGCGIFRR